MAHGPGQMKSIRKISENHFYFFIFHSLLIADTFIYVVRGGYLIPHLDSKSRETLVHINSLAIALNNYLNSEDSSKPDTGTLFPLYLDMEESYQGLDRRLTKGLTLPGNQFSNPGQVEKSLSDLRTFAYTLRANLSALQKRYNRINLILVTLSILFTSIQFRHFLYWRKNQFLFLSSVRSGVSSIEDILRFQSGAREVSLNSDFEEIMILKDNLFKIEKEIMFDRRIQEIDIHGNLDEVLRELHGIFSREMDAQRIGLAFINQQGRVMAETACSTLDKMILTPGYSMNLSESTLNKLKHSSEYRIIDDLDEYLRKNSVTEATRMIYDEGIRSSITYPIRFRNHCVGFVFVSSTEKNAYTGEQASFGKRVISLLKHKLYMEYILQDIIAQTSNAFVTLMHEKDNETSDHIIRMSQYSYIIARSYSKLCQGLSPKFIREILLFAPLHDIGKIGVPDNVLTKPGPLDGSEWKIMRGHVDIGENVMKEISGHLSEYFSLPAMQTAVDLIIGHHEKFDGSGYPRGLSGAAIPLAGRIVAIADVFDALTSARPYKKAFSLERSLQIMEEEMPGHFDPEVFESFRASLDEIVKVYEKYREI